MIIHNPLHLKNEIFSDKFKNSLKNKYTEFLNEFFYHWAYFVYAGEYETTIIYPSILKNLQNGVYDSIVEHLSKDEKDKVYSYFNDMITDENQHKDLFDSLLIDTFNKKLTEYELKTIESNATNFLNESALINLLIRYYVGECYLWTSFYLIYKNTTDIKTKELFHRVLVDESHHNNNIYKFFKKIQNNIEFDNAHYISYTKNLRQFGLPFTLGKFSLTDSGDKKSQQINELVYNHYWHHSFNEIFLKKCYQLYQLIYPDVSFREFFNLINKNELSWIPCKS